MTLGHFEVLNADVEVKALRVSDTPAGAANQTTHEATGADVNVDAIQAQSNQPNSHEPNRNTERNQRTEREDWKGIERGRRCFEENPH